MGKVYQEENKIPTLGGERDWYTICKETCNLVKPLIRYNNVGLSAK